MAAGGADVLVSGALLLFIGVAAALLFERYRLPDVVVLLLAGILIGPVLGLVDAAAFEPFAAPFTALALVVIMFEGGLDLHVGELKRRLGFTTVLLVSSYFLTAAVVGAVALVVGGFPLGAAALLGLVLAPLSSSILIPLARRLRVLPATRALLTVESALGDVLAVLAVVTLAGALAGEGVDAEGVAGSLGSSFVLGGLLAVGAGVVWLLLLRYLQGRSFTYLVTFAAAVLLYGLVERVGGNGVVAVLAFGLVLGNAETLAARVPGLVVYRLDDRIRWFHGEMSFLVRTFFFVYLGLLVDPGVLSGPVVLLSVASVAAIVLVRVGLVAALVRERPEEREDAGYLAFLVPRGLATAALATIAPVLVVAADLPFRDVTFAVVLLSNVVMTTFILVKEGGPGEGADPEAALLDLTTLDLAGLQTIDVEDEGAEGPPPRA